jgi:hypothetical protein
LINGKCHPEKAPASRRISSYDGFEVR